MDESKLIEMLIRLTDEVAELRQSALKAGPDFITIHDPRLALLILQKEALVKAGHEVEFRNEQQFLRARAKVKG